MKRLTLGICLFASSCGLFSPSDATPAMTAVQEMEGVFVRQSAAFTEVVRQAGGINDAQRARMLAGIEKDRSDYRELSDSLRGWLGELGRIDWAAIAKQIYGVWRGKR